MIPLAIILVLALHVYLAVRAPAVALITSLIATAAMFVIFCFLNSAAGAAVSLLLIFPTTCLAIVLARGAPDSDSAAQTVAKWALIILGWIVAGMVGSSLGGPLGIFGLLFLILFVGMTISYLLKSRDAIAAYVVSTISACMRQNLPLAGALESAAAGRTDKRARILKGIARHLAEGKPLSEAVRAGYRKCPGYVVAMIAAAERIDQLPAAIGSIEADMARKAQEDAMPRPIQPWYPVLLLLLALFLLTGFSVFILPKFACIFESFGISNLPAITRVLVNYHGYLGQPILGLLILLIPLGTTAWIYVKFRPRRPEAPHFFSVIGDFFKWRLPGFRWFERNYSLLHASELLRLSLNAGATIDQAIANTLTLDVNGHFRKRLVRWLDKVRQGQNVSAAAADSGLPNALAWAFETKLNSADIPVLLGTIERTCRSNYNYRINLIRSIFWPWAVIMMGAFVGFIVLAIFLPLIMIINVNTGMVIP